jgi:DNA-binding MarR family transcriptional regulator
MPTAKHETPGSVCLRHWREASRWRKLVDKELAPLGLSLTEWIVLDATLQLVRKTGDAVNQNQVARHTSLQPMVVSNAMQKLDRRGFVSRGPDCMQFAWRVFVREPGVEAVVKGRARIEAVSRAWKRG